MNQNFITSIINFFSENWLILLTKGISAFLVFIIFYLLINLVVKKVKYNILQNNLQNDQYTTKIANLVGKIIFVVLMIFNFLAVFQIVGFNVGLIIGGLSLSIGFAMENIIGNMIAGILIITHKKIKIGQTIKLLGKFDNLVGTIEEIQIRYTTIRLIDKRRLLIPNLILSSTPIQTIQDNPLIRGEFKIKIHRDNDIEVVKKLILQAINEQKGVVYDGLTSVFMPNFDINGIVIKAVYFIERKIGKNSFMLNKKIKPRIIELFRKYGIKLTYQNMVIDIEK